MAYPTIIAIETATSCCSVALTYNGQISERSQVGNNAHSQVVLGMVQELLAAAAISVRDLTVIAVGQGPGSFTGLRIGVGVAQGLAYGVDCPMIGVSSLDALALQAPIDGQVLAGIDARMGEVYWAEYCKENGGVKRLNELQVSPPEVISVSANSVRPQLVGNAWAEYAIKLAPNLREIRPCKDVEFPSAAMLVQLATQMFEQGKVTNAVDFAPEYVRNDVAKKSKLKAN